VSDPVAWRGRLGGYGDALGRGDGFGDGEAVFVKAGDMDRDAFADELFCLFAAVAHYAESGEIRGVGSPTAVVASLEDDQILTHALLQTCLPQNTLACAFWHVFSGFSRDRHATRFGGVFVLLMATNGVVKSPAVLLDEFDNLSEFHFYLSIKAMVRGGELCVPELERCLHAADG
jgi:hypothetical protein